MEQIIVTHLDSSTTKLQSKQNVSTITRANQKVELLGADTVEISVESATKLNFYIGDKITVIGRDYTLNTPAKERKLSERKFVYDMVFEGVQYDMLRVSYSVNVDTTSNEIQDLSGDSLTGDLKMFLDVLLSNANRVFPGKWVLGTYPTDTETKTLTFGDSDNCLSVLQSLCSEGNYNTEFSISIAPNGVRTLSIGATGNDFPYTFQYGKGKGLYELTREKVSSTNIVTRLSVYGSSRNINTSKYRAFRLCLPGKTKGQSYLESATGIASYGVWEQTKNFEEIYPRRTGTISALGDSELKFVDSSMNFDRNEKDGSGNTLYIIPGAADKIHFNTGNLAGYEFEITSYNHTTKTFTLRPFTDENGYTFPSPTNAAFQFAQGDKYVILDIYLPQSYIDAAEAELQAAGQEYLDKYSQPNVMYGLTVDPLFLKDVVGAEVEANIVWVGDYIPVKDTDLDVDKNIRVKGFTRDLLKDYAYSLTIADLAVTVSTISRVVSDLRGIDNVVRINNLNDPAWARRNYKATTELVGMIETVQAEAALIGNDPASQFQITGAAIKPNYGGNANALFISASVVYHNYYPIGNPSTWNVAQLSVTGLASSTAYFVYIKASKSAGTAVFYVSSTKIAVEEIAGYFHFPFGILSSVVDDVRIFNTTKGYTLISGDSIKTGKITSQDGSTFFDLDSGEIQGKISFSSGSSGYSNLADKPDLSVFTLQDDVDALTANLQAQIDGQIMTWFYDYVPTLANAPANGWATNADKDKHLGDLFYNSATGIGYRFSKIGSVYSWQVLKDTDVATALANAAAAQTTANSKKRVFLVTPTTPYEVGDLWTQGTSGELMRCKTTRLTGSYTAADWEKAVKYTDDTAVNELEIGSRNILINSSFPAMTISSDRVVTSIVGNNRVVRVDDVSADGYIAKSFIIPEDYVNKKLTFSLAVNANWTINFYLRAKCDSTGYDVSTPYYLTNNPERGLKAELTFTPNHNTVTLFVYTLSRVNLTLLDGYMLVLGEKGQRWTPAPEDVQAEIDAYSYLKEAMQNSTDIQGGLLSTTLIKLGAVNQSGTWVEKAGVNGAGTSDNIPRLYAGGTLQQAANRIAGQLSNAAKFVVTQGGKIYGMEVELFGSFRTAPPGGKNIHINHVAGAVTIHDDNGDEKTIISSDAIPTLASLLAPHSSSVDATTNISKYVKDDAQTTVVNKVLVLPTTSSNYTVSTPPIACSLATHTGDPNDPLALVSATVTVQAKLITPGSTVTLGTVSSGVQGPNQDDSQVQTIPGQTFGSMPPGTYTLRITMTLEAVNPVSTAQGSAVVSAPGLLTGVSVVEVSRILRNGIFLIQDANNYAYLNPTGIKEKSQVAPDRPGVLLSGRGGSTGGSAALWGAKKHATLTVSKVTTGTYTVYHSIGHKNYSVQVTPMDVSRNVGWASPQTDRFTVYTYSGGSLADTNFSFVVFGDN